MPTSHRASRSRRSPLLIGVSSALALSGLVVVAAGVPAEAEPARSVTATSSTAALNVADRTSALERATRAAVRVQNAEARSERLAREKKLRQERQERVAAQEARTERLAKQKAAREAEAKRKAAVEAEKARKAAAAASSRSQVRSVAPNSGDTRAIGRAMAAARGWTGEQWTCLNNLWTKESNWRTTAANPSGAYGIPQSMPGSKMASAGADWRTNPATQIKWGLGYISGRYGTPCGAWNASQTKGWY